jgi:hypothetical protein
MPCDYSKYPDNWFTEIRPRILARAGNCCEHPDCGFANNSVVWSIERKGFPIVWVQDFTGLGRLFKKKAVRVVLTVAPLDHDPENRYGKDERLRALCQLHHLRLDAKSKAERRNGLRR